MASSSVLHGKEGKLFPPSHKLFPSHGFVAMEEQKMKVQDFNLTGTASACEEQSTDRVRKVKANWVNDSIFGSYGLSEHSSSSGLSSPFGSELGSTETDETESEEDEDFIAQLTRQMTDYMFKDDEKEVEASVVDNDADEDRVPNYTPNTVQISNPSGFVGNWSNYNSREICYYNQESLGTYVKPVADSVNHQGKSSNTVFYSSDNLKRPIQVYHLKDQPTTTKQRLQKLKTEKHSDQNNMQSTFIKKQTVGGHGNGGDKILHHHHYPIQSNGASMRAIFLRGSGLINGSSGTGVFLPTIHSSSTVTLPKKKSGSSTVLIPTRVLQALQQHFNHTDALSQSNTSAVSPSSYLPQYDAEDLVSKENQYSEDEEMQLPQEWTY